MLNPDPDPYGDKHGSETLILILSSLVQTVVTSSGMDNGRDLRALDYKVEEVDLIFKTFLTQDFIPQ